MSHIPLNPEIPPAVVETLHIHGITDYGDILWRRQHKSLIRTGTYEASLATNGLLKLACGVISAGDFLNCLSSANYFGQRQIISVEGKLFQLTENYFLRVTDWSA